MATWTNIPDSVLEPGKPARSVDALALRDNPIAIAQGAAGAPKVLAAALNRSNNEAQWLISVLSQGQAVAGTEYIVMRNAGGGPSGNYPASGLSGGNPNVFYPTVITPGSYRIDLTATRQTSGGSGATIVNVLKNGAVIASSPARGSGTAVETFTLSFAHGDSIGFSVSPSGATDRSKSISVSEILIRTTNANKGFMV